MWVGGCVGVWCVEGEALSPVELQSFISVWNILVLDEEVKALSPLCSWEFRGVSFWKWGSCWK